MCMLKNARLEKLAQSYVKLCGDEVEAYREAFEEASEGKTPHRLKKLFATLVAKDATFWRRVVALQKPIETQIALSALGVLQQWTRIATADATALSSIVSRYAPCCNDTDEGPTCSGCKKPRTAYQFVNFADTHTLTPEQKLLYKSAEQTKHGIKLHLRDQDAALINIAKASGMFTERLQVFNNVGSKPVLPPLPEDPNEASRIYQEWVTGT